MIVSDFKPMDEVNWKPGNGTRAQQLIQATVWYVKNTKVFIRFRNKMNEDCVRCVPATQLQKVGHYG